MYIILEKVWNFSLIYSLWFLKHQNETTFLRDLLGELKKKKPKTNVDIAFIN